MSKDNLKDLERKSIPKLILSYSLTTFIALTLGSLYTLSDAVIIGRGISVEALGGITAVLPFTVLQSAISTMIGGGAAILVSQYLGKNDKKKAGEAVFTAAITFWTVSLIITALGLIFLDPLLSALGVADNLKIYAKPYLKILLIGNIFSTGFSSVMRAEGKMLYALLQWVIPVSINIVADVILVLVLKFGVEGAAYSTIICQFISVITALIFFTKFSSLEFKGIKWNKKSLSEIFTVGFPSLIQTGSVAVGMALLNNVLRSLGGDGLQITYGFISKIFTFCIVPLTAIAQALQPIAGYNHGAGKPERIKSAMKYSVLFSFAAAMIPLIICELLPKLLIGIFTSDNTLINSAVPALRRVAAAYPFMFLPSLVGVLLQSTGKKISAALLYAASFVFVPPFALIFGMQKDTANVWISFPIAGLVASVIAAITLILFFKQYYKKPLSIQ